MKKIILLLAILGWGLANSASAQILNEPMTGSTAPGWVIGGSAYLTASTGVDPAGSGWLRLTSVTNNEAGYAFLNSPFNITQGAVIQFDYVTWGGAGDGGFGCGETGADGYSVYLFDGSIDAGSFSVGGTGGSLGYAQYSSSGDPGLTMGYIGVGIDEWGNFSNPTEGRLGGPGGRCNAVTVRGPYNHPSGNYYYLGATASNIAQLAFPGQVFRPSQTSAQYRKVVIYLTPVSAPNYLRVDVYLQTGYNQPLVQVLNGLMVGRPVPASVKVGYAASTGGSTNYHEIRNLIIDPLPASNIDLGISKIASSPTVTAGGPVTYTVTARNYGPSNVTASNVPIIDTVPAVVTGVAWTCVGAGGATCGAASGSGNAISTTATLPRNGVATYTITGTINPATAPGTQITNTATLTVSGGITDTDANNNTSSAIVSVTAAPVSISGYVYSDSGAGGGTAHNGVRDGTEGAPGGGNYYVKLFRSSDLTTAVQVLGPLAGAYLYTFNNVPSYYTYTIIVSSDNSVNFTPSSPSNDWIYTSPINFTLWNVAVAGANITNQNFGVYNGSRITGKVIRDDGLNGATANANDGVLNAAEVGISGVTVRLRNNTNTTTYDTTTTDSGGNFALFTNLTSRNLRIYETNPAGHLSVSYNAGTTGGAYTIGGDYIAFAYTQYTDYSGVLFGDVPDTTFQPTPRAQSNTPGSMVYYAHTLTPGSGGSVTFSTNNRTTTPAAPAWAAVVYYRDIACNGSYNAGTDTVISGALTASAGTPLCILAAVAIPAGATSGTTDALTIRATFTFTNSIGPVVQNYTVIDTTTVVAAPSLTVVKSVQLLSDPFNNATNPKAIPGAIMQYTIIVTNSGVGTVDGNSLAITDPISTNTALCVSNTCSNPPVTFVCSGTPPCGLTFSYATAVTFSNQPGGTAPFNYTPVPDATGYDANVTGVRINPSGVMNGSGGGNPSFTTTFRVRVN